MPVTVGVIGCGNIAKFHFSGLKKAGAKVKWICDLSKEAAQPWGQQFGATYTDDYRRLLDDKQIQAVEVLTISSTHKAMCLDAVAAGKAVICEKTLATSPDDALEITRAAEKAGTILYTSYMKRFIPAVAQARQLLPSLGRIFSTHIRAYQSWSLPWDEVTAEESFFHASPGAVSEVRRRYGGGILVCGGSHILDLVCFFLGRPRRLMASMHYPKGTDLDIQAAALMETDNGVVHFEATAHPLRAVGFLRDGWDERIEINGTGGRLDIYSAAWDQVDHKASLLVHYDNATGKSTEYRYSPSSPFDKAVEFFCRSIEAGRQGEQPRTTGYDVDELIAAITRSATQHQAVEMQWRI